MTGHSNSSLVSNACYFFKAYIQNPIADNLLDTFPTLICKLWPGLVDHILPYLTFLGDMERTFLVLRESVAFERLKAKDQARGGSSGAPGNPGAPGPSGAQGNQPDHPEAPVPEQPPANPKQLPKPTFVSTPGPSSQAPNPTRLTPIVHPVPGLSGKTTLKPKEKVKHKEPKEPKEQKEGRERTKSSSKGSKRDASPEETKRPKRQK
jgi:hypothetical protein